MYALPEDAFSTLVSILIVVVLPAPFGPVKSSSVVFLIRFLQQQHFKFMHLFAYSGHYYLIDPSTPPAALESIRCPLRLRVRRSQTKGKTTVVHIENAIVMLYRTAADNCDVIDIFFQWLIHSDEYTM